VRGGVFPKKANPVAAIEAKGWPVKIVQKPGSMLNRCDLDIGHRKVSYAVVKVWLKDIEDGNFTIVKTGNDQVEDVPNQTKTRSTAGKKRNHKAMDDAGSKSDHTNKAGTSKRRRRLKNLVRGIGNQDDSQLQKKNKKHQKSTRSDCDEDSTEESNEDTNKDSDEDSNEDLDEDSDENSNADSNADSNA
jgi:hypothetical protein